MSRRASASSSSPLPDTFTLSPSSRGILASDETMKLIASHSEKPYITIDLSGVSLGDTFLTQTVPNLTKLAELGCLKAVNFSDIISSPIEPRERQILHNIAFAIGNSNILHSVDLSKNALGIIGITSFKHLLSGQEKIQMLFLRKAKLDTQSVRMLFSYLEKSLSNIRVLDFHGNPMKSCGLTEMAAIVKKAPCLRRLLLSYFNAPAAFVAQLSESLSVPASLSELDISGNKIDVAVAGALSEVLRHKDSLSILAMCDMKMGNEALDALLKPLLETSSGVEKLLLAGNKLGAEAVGILREYLTSHVKNVRVLDVSRNELGDEGITQLAEAFKHSGTRSVLTELNVSYNNASALSIVELAQEVVKMAWLTRFDVRGMSLGKETAKKLAEAFSGIEFFAEESERANDDIVVQNALQKLTDIRKGRQLGGTDMESSRVTQEEMKSKLSRMLAQKDENTRLENEKCMGTPREYGGARKSLERNGWQREEAIESARKLERSLASLDREMYNATGELEMSASSESRNVIYSKREESGTEIELINELLVDRQQGRGEGCLSWIADLVGGVLVAIFVVLPIVGIVQWQEEMLPGFRAV